MKFHFQKLEVYRKAKSFHAETIRIINHNSIKGHFKDQLSRASLSIALNIAEGSGRFSRADRKNFFVISRSSVFECVAIMDIMKDHDKCTFREYKGIETCADELSRMLYTMIKNLE